MASAQVTIVYKAVNQFTGAVQTMQASAQQFEARLLHLGNAMNSMRNNTQRLNAVMQGLGVGVGIGSFYALERAIGSALRVIPDLLNKGLDWMKMLDDLQDKTGMSATSVASWAAAIKFTGGDVERFATSAGRLSKVVEENEGKFTAWGIATRDAAGNLLPVDALLGNLRNRLQALGPGSATSTAALQLLSRSGLDFVDVLMLSDRQMTVLNQKFRDMGLFVGQDAITAAENLARTRAELDLAFTGVGTQIATAVTPVLTQLVTAISAAIHDNMAQIVEFATKAIYFVTGLVQGFFNLNLSLTSTTTALGALDTRWADGQKAATDFANAQQDIQDQTDAATSALERQIRAIDNQIRALDRREQAHDAARERKDILQSIKDAKAGGEGQDAVSKAIQRQIDAIDKQIDAIRRRKQAQDDAKKRDELVGQITDLEAELAELQGKGIFTAGMTALEAELARQKQAADIEDQMKKISDARGQLADHDKDVADRQTTDALERNKQELQDRLRTHEAMIQSQKRLTDAIDRLREFDHNQEVQHNRQALEDRKRNLQDQIQAIRDAAKKAAAALDPLRQPLPLFGSGPGALSSSVSSWGKDLHQAISDAADTAQADGKRLADNIRTWLFGSDQIVPQHGEHAGVVSIHAEGLIEKIGDLISKMSDLIDAIGEQGGNLGKNVLDPLGDLFKNLFPSGNGNRTPGGAQPGGFNRPGYHPADLGGIAQTGGIAGLIWGALSKVVPGLPGPAGVAKTLLGFGEGGAALHQGVGGLLQGGGGLLSRMFGGLFNRPGGGGGVSGPPTPPMANIPAPNFRYLAGAGVGGNQTDMQRTQYEMFIRMGMTPDQAAARSGYNPQHPAFFGGILGQLMNGGGPGRNVMPHLLTGGGAPPAGGTTDAQRAFRALMHLDDNTGQGGPLFRTLYDSLGVQDQQNGKLDDSVAAQTATTDKLNTGVDINEPHLADIAVNTQSTNLKLGGTLDANIKNKPSVTVPDPTKVYTTGGATVDVNSPGSNTVKVATPGSNVVEVGGVPLDAIKGGVKNTANNTSYAAGLRFLGPRLSMTTAAGTVTPGGCFLYGTMVETPYGKFPIEEIQKGDMVYSIDLETMEPEARKVTAVHRHPDHTQAQYRITLADGRILISTDDHPLYNPRAGDFLEAQQFSAGMVLLDMEKGEQEIVAVDFMGVVTANFCDLTVAKHHNYLVADGILAHNAGSKFGNAEGLLGMTKGETNIGIAGEAGTEAVAILRNPHEVRFGGGMPTEIVIPVTIVLDGRKIEENVTRRQIRFGAFSSTTVTN